MVWKSSLGRVAHDARRRDGGIKVLLTSGYLNLLRKVGMLEK